MTESTSTDVVVVGRVHVDGVPQWTSEAVLVTALSILLHQLRQINELAVLDAHLTLHNSTSTPVNKSALGFLT